MSFFRVLFALLISAGIAYGLYLAADSRRLDRVVEAVRTEIMAPAEDAVVAEAPVEAEGEQDAPLEAEVATSEAPGVDAEPLVEGTDDDPEVVVASDEPTETEATGFAARIEEDTAMAEVEAPATMDPEEADPEEADAADTTGENDLPRIAAMPAPPETMLPDDAQAPEALEAPADAPEADGPVETVETTDAGDATDTADTASIADTTLAAETTGPSDATAALGIVNGRMNYVEARETMIGAGWSPRLPAARTGGPTEAENAMIEAGYGELEGCNDAPRPICRFEFVDDEKRIAAVLTAGAGTDPSVIDAFLMNIRAE